MKHNLKATGLSMSQASSVSNLCYQRAHEIATRLSGLNNATRTFQLGGEKFTEVVGKPVPEDVEKLLIEQAKLHAAQGFLISNIKAKDELLRALRVKPFKTDLEAPEKPKYKDYDTKSAVDNNWGWDQLNDGEFAEYIEAEAHAAHIGKFIHKGGTLDILRAELPTIKQLDWVSVKDGERIPVKIEPHHEAAKLLETHEKLAAKHREYEQLVNYFKAKVKNLISDENARIAKENAIKQAEINQENEKIRAEYDALYAVYAGKVRVEKEEFEAKREEEIKSTSMLRIAIDPRFQSTIDEFLKGLKSEEEETK